MPYTHIHAHTSIIIIITRRMHSIVGRVKQVVLCISLLKKDCHATIQYRDCCFSHYCCTIIALATRNTDPNIKYSASPVGHLTGIACTVKVTANTLIHSF